LVEGADFTLKSKQASGMMDVKLSNNFGKRTRSCFSSRWPSRCLHAGDVRNYRRLECLCQCQREVIGISVDSPFAQEAWAQKEKIGIISLQRSQ